MGDFKKDVGSRIRRIRTENGLKLEDLENLTGITNSALSKIERGVVNVSAENLYLISKAIFVSADYLLTGERNSSYGTKSGGSHSEKTINLSSIEEELLQIIRELDQRNVQEIMSIAKMKFEMDKTYSKKGSSSKSTSEQAATIERDKKSS